MAAAPQYGTLLFIGLRTGRTYAVDVYHSDVDGALVNFDGGGGASSSSPEEWTPSQEAVRLVDYSIVTGMTDTTKIQVIIGGRATGDHLRYTMFVNTLAKRPPLSLVVGRGSRLSAIQRA